MDIAYEKEMQAYKQKQMSENLYKGRTHDGKDIKKRPQTITEPQWRSANAEVPKSNQPKKQIRSPEK